ncbi:MAG: type II secretion system major pseudopilin GspG [Opitutales bacterium]|nr:type II secretion system major pseudopilin GspG [Opitutales bacterium]
MEKGKRRANFSLVEMLIFFGIFAVVVLFFYSNYFKMKERSRMRVAQTYIQETLPSALEAYKIDIGEYPADEQGLEALLSAPLGLEKKWKGPYIPCKKLLDPWGNDYLYTFPSTQGDGEYDLWSRGPDGIPSADDIANWKIEKNE